MMEDHFVNVGDMCLSIFDLNFEFYDQNTELSKKPHFFVILILDFINFKGFFINLKS